MTARIISLLMGRNVGLDGGRVGVLDGVKLPIMAEEQINKLLDVPGSPRERTCVLGRVPEKLGKGMPFDSRQMISSKYPWLVT